MPKLKLRNNAMGFMETKKKKCKTPEPSKRMHSWIGMDQRQSQTC